jgi:thiol-disulfide isomerase/thioredoxin
MKNIITYLCYAVLCISLFSCKDKNPIQIKSIQVSVNPENVLLGDTVAISVEALVNDSYEDYTNDENTTIYVNNNEINGNSFVANEPKVYEIKARYIKGNISLYSHTVTVEAINPEIPNSYAHKVLIEDFTGTWCGWCPRVVYACELLEKETENSIVVALHMKSGSVDPYNFSAASTLASSITQRFASSFPQGFGYPAAAINRNEIWNGPEFNYISQALNAIDAGGSPYGIAINSSMDLARGSITVKIAFEKSLQGAKYCVYILEDSLHYNQENYYTAASSFPLFGGASVLANFNHMNVARGVATSILGYAIPNDQSVAGHVYENTFPNALHTSQKVSNVRIVVALIDNVGRILNAQTAPANVNQDFQLK